MNAVSISECRKFVGAGLHKTLAVGKNGAFVSLIKFREIDECQWKMEFYFQAVQAFPPWAYSTFKNMSVAQKIVVVSVAIGGWVKMIKFDLYFDNIWNFFEFQFSGLVSYQIFQT